MKVFCSRKYLSCLYYDSDPHPMVEVMKITKETVNKMVLSGNKIVFLLEGLIRIISQDQSETVVEKGEFIFAPVGTTIHFRATKNSQLMSVSVNGNIRLCKGFDIESLFDKAEPLPHRSQKTPHSVASLKMNRMLWDFVGVLRNALSDELLCKYYFEIKVQELFVILRAYYTKEQLRDFFYYILSPNMVFSEFVRANWRTYNTVQKLANAMNMSRTHFIKRFKTIFSKPPAAWLADEKTQCILEDIQEDKKTFQEIASDYGFTATSNFNRFCKTNLGETPNEIRKKMREIGK